MQNGRNEVHMSYERARRIVTAHAIRHPGTPIKYRELRPMVPGLSEGLFYYLMNSFKSQDDFAVGSQWIRYDGPPREVLPVDALPDVVKEGNKEADILMAAKRGINTISGLKKEFPGYDVKNIVTRLKRKHIFGSNGYGKLKIEGSVSNRPVRAKLNTLNPALLAALEEHATGRRVPYATIIKPLVQRGFNSGSVYARLHDFAKQGLIEAEAGMVEYFGEPYSLEKAAEYGVVEMQTHKPVAYSGELPVWWTALRETQNGEGRAIRDMERAFEGLPYLDKQFVASYFLQVLCNQHTTADTYEPRGSDFRMAAIVSDTVIKYRGEDGLLPELRAVLQLLSPEDPRTADTLGRYLLGNVPREVGLERLGKMSAKRDAGAVYQMVREFTGKYTV